MALLEPKQFIKIDKTLLEKVQSRRMAGCMEDQRRDKVYKDQGTVA